MKRILLAGTIFILLLVAVLLGRALTVRSRQLQVEPAELAAIDTNAVIQRFSGALRFRFGEDQEEEVVVGAGEIVLIPSGLLHSASADEDTFELDIFCPPRRDWIEGDDAYMRQ